MSNIARFTICCLSFLLLPALSAAASPRDSTYKIYIEAGGGYGLSKDSISQAVSRYGVSGTFRIMWKADHRLAVGLETGVLQIASVQDDEIENEFGTVRLRASLKAIPVMVVFDMNIWRLNIYTGLGYYHVFSTVGVENEALTNTRWNVGFYLSAAYKHPLTETIKLGGELKWCSIGELGKTLLSAQVFISYRLFEW